MKNKLKLIFITAMEIMLPVVITTIVVSFLIIYTITHYFYIVLKNDITTLGCCYEKDAITFDDDYASLVEQLKVFSGFDKDGHPLEIIRHGSLLDGGYAIAKQAFNATDAVMGYGIANDISFEESFSDIYQKPSFGFDCGVTNIDIKNNLCHLIPECIASDSTLYTTQKSTGKVSSYSEQVRRLQLENKKLFIKMDIEGAEYEAFEDILKSSTDNITGIALEIHIWNKDLLQKAIQLLEHINENFILIHVHAIKSPSIPMKQTSNIHGCISNQIELSFINKKLLSSYQISASQKHPTTLDYPNLATSGELYWEIKNDS